MKIDDALYLISSEHPHERLRGARALWACGRDSDIPAIEKALAKETVPWVRKALGKALENSILTLVEEQSDSNPQEILEASIDDATLRDIYLRASEEIVSTLLHEIQPKIGYIRNAAISEIHNFDQSVTKKQIEYLEELLSLLAEFRKVSQIPDIESFDLADLIDSVIGELKPTSIRVAGQRPMVVYGDRKRIRLAITNGLRNAIEATKVVADDNERLIVINWASDNENYWVSIVDQGVGIHGHVQGMFEIGKTTKADHFGMGLPLAKQAMMSIGGDVKLSPGAQGGARFELIWEKAPVITEGDAE